MSNAEPIVLPFTAAGWVFPQECPACNAFVEGEDTIWEVDVGSVPHPLGHGQLARCLECHHMQPFVMAYREGDDEESRRVDVAKGLVEKGHRITEEELFAALQAEADVAHSRVRAVTGMWEHWRGRAHHLERDLAALVEKDEAGVAIRVAEASDQADAARLELQALVLALHQLAICPDRLPSSVWVLDKTGAAPRAVQPEEVRGVFVAMRNYADAATPRAKDAMDALRVMAALSLALEVPAGESISDVGHRLVSLVGAASDLECRLDDLKDDEANAALDRMRKVLVAS